jgi:exopolysaccharide biosynthesis polyprenyl glycosylphosphotransferase
MSLNRDNGKRRTLVIGTGTFAETIISELKNHPECGYQLVGIVAERARNKSSIQGFPVVGAIEDLRLLVDAFKPERLIVAMSGACSKCADHHLLEARVCQNIVIEDAEAVYEHLTGKLPIESLTPREMIFSNEFEPARLSLFAGRVLSLVFAVGAIVALAPLMLLIAIAIKLDSKGQVLFVQDRVGLAGKKFKLLKFRTMHASEQKTSEWAADNDHRITRVGRWLRKFRLDELPQFFNVLFNDMNLVGPRPHPMSNFELFVLVSRNMPECGMQIPYYSLRLKVRPGITGWAQVRYQYANNLNEEIEKLKFDLYYIKHYSLWMDLCILVKTIGIVLKGHGASEPTVNTTVPRAAAASQTNI